MMMLPVLQRYDGKSHVSCHMNESECFSGFRFRMVQAFRCSKSRWTTQYERPDGAMLGTPAGRLWHFESRCMSSDRPCVPMFGSFATTHDSAQAEILQKLNDIL